MTVRSGVAVLLPKMSREDIGRKAARTHKRNGTHPRALGLTAFGTTGSLKQLVERYSTMAYKTVQQRIYRGATLEDALTK